MDGDGFRRRNLVVKVRKSRFLARYGACEVAAALALCGERAPGMPNENPATLPEAG